MERKVFDVFVYGYDPTHRQFSETVQFFRAHPLNAVGVPDAIVVLEGASPSVRIGLENNKGAKVDRYDWHKRFRDRARVIHGDKDTLHNNHYERLGVSRTATAEQIEQAWRAISADIVTGSGSKIAACVSAMRRTGFCLIRQSAAGMMRAWWKLLSRRDHTISS